MPGRVSSFGESGHLMDCWEMLEPFLFFVWLLWWIQTLSASLELGKLKVLISRLLFRAGNDNCDDMIDRGFCGVCLGEHFTTERRGLFILDLFDDGGLRRMVAVGMQPEGVGEQHCTVGKLGTKYSLLK